ncbi:hypothetical protein EV356DRAFT_292095 [Viridothelium virens]|uniref:Uncharacterized protein n=1 Tax=Viridothelium virens TaxID=1048519 RepID=A0A6A6H0Y2_VIRVR|nr:hypothetical protein EV356DRAFT_292095 [Viridothelium virens]
MSLEEPCAKLLCGFPGAPVVTYSQGYQASFPCKEGNASGARLTCETGLWLHTHATCCWVWTLPYGSTLRILAYTHRADEITGRSLSKMHLALGSEANCVLDSCGRSSAKSDIPRA